MTRGRVGTTKSVRSEDGQGVCMVCIGGVLEMRDEKTVGPYKVVCGFSE